MSWFQDVWTDDQTERFFDLIADGVSIGKAGQAVGKSRGAAAGKFDRERRKMGAQAS